VAVHHACFFVLPIFCRILLPDLQARRSLPLLPLSLAALAHAPALPVSVSVSVSALSPTMICRVRCAQSGTSVIWHAVASVIWHAVVLRLRLWCFSFWSHFRLLPVAGACAGDENIGGLANKVAYCSVMLKIALMWRPLLAFIYLGVCVPRSQHSLREPPTIPLNA
jgi:hypothetical protein